MFKVHHWFVGEVFRQLGKHLGGALVGLSVMNEMAKQTIKIFPLTSGDEAKLDNIIKQCIERKQLCRT